MVAQLCGYTKKRLNSVLCKSNLGKVVIKKSPLWVSGTWENPSVQLAHTQHTLEDTFPQILTRKHQVESGAH